MRFSDWSADMCSSYLEPYIATMTLDEGLHNGANISRRNSYIPLLKSFIERRIATALLRGAESGEFRAHVDPERFYWMVFSMSTAPFLNTQVMCQASGLSFATESGVALRSEERRVGQGWVSTCRSRWSRHHQKKKNTHETDGKNM